MPRIMTLYGRTGRSAAEVLVAYTLGHHTALILFVKQDLLL